MPPKGRPRQSARRTTTGDDSVQDTVDPGRPRENLALSEEGQDDSIHADDPSQSNPQSQAVEPRQPSSTQTASVSSLPPSRVERLASLKPQRGVSGPATPTNPSEIQTKRVRFQPKVAVRRSKEEREALEKAESERRQARLVASANFSAPASRVTRGILKGRGGASRWHNSERLAESGASGFLGGASPAEEGRLKLSASSRGRGGRSSLLAGTSRDTTKADDSKSQNERAVRKSKDKDGDVAAHGAGGRKTRTTVKKEDKKPAHVSSSDEEPFEVQPPGRRVNVEHINLVSDEDSAEETKDDGKGKEKEKSTKLPATSFMRPIRINRREHVERMIGVNTDASSVTSAELQRRAKARGDAEGSVFLPTNAELKDSKGQKGKSREKDQDVEFLRHEIREPGIYPDEDQNAGAQVKQEPTDAGEVTAIDDGNELSVTAITQEVLNQPNRPSREPTPIPKRPAKPRPRRRSRRKLNARKPILQTDEDRKEWERYQEDMALICEELRRARSLSPPQGPEPTTATTTTTTDEQDPKASQESKGKSKGKDKKDGLIYLFQLPPLMPELQQQLDKSKNPKTRRRDSGSGAKEPAASQDKSEAASAHGSNNRDPEPEAKPAIESDPDPDPSIFTSAQSSRMPSGQVGEIMLDRDGFPSAVWGKTKMDVGRASAYGALQEVIILRTGLRGKREQMGEVTGENAGKVREAEPSKGGKPGETGSGKRGKVGETGSGKREKAGEARSKKVGKAGEVRSGEGKKAGEDRSAKGKEAGKDRPGKGKKADEDRSKKGGKAGEDRSRKGGKAGKDRSGRRERRGELRSEKMKGKRVRKRMPRLEGWAIGQMGGGFVMVPDWNGFFAKGRGRRRKAKKKKKGKAGECSSGKPQGTGPG
ncbi:MAG: hypothetical protein Q9167_007488 [Letrouitia subvulpina]